jgi:8-oxo-dGTP pyrophosphatase MutT (NUDIX family)
MNQSFSDIQNGIISKLKNAKTLRYSELWNKKIPNDLFNYHLQFLVKKGFLNKNTKGYGLSDTGIKLVADPFKQQNDSITSLFKINVITIVSRKVNGKLEILNQIRKSNPSYGKVGIPGGVVLKGELIEPAATRKLMQETGLRADFKIVGCERRIMYKNGEIFSDVMFPIAYTDKSEGELIVDSNFGHNMWVPIDKAIKNESLPYDSLQSIVKILKFIKSGKIKSMPFLFEENIQSDI